MSDFEQLLMILGVIYLLECLWYVGPDATLVTIPLNRRFSTVKRCDRRGPCLAGLLPFGWACLSEPWPLTVSPQAVCCRDATAQRSVRCVHFDEVCTVEAVDRDILVNDAAFAKTTTRVMAENLAALLRRLQACRADQRPPIIHAAMAAALDRNGVQRHLDATATRLVGLRVASAVLWACVFVALPAVYWWVGLPAGLWWVLPGYSLSLLAVIGLYGWLGRGACPSGHGSGPLRAAIMALAPTTAMRAGHSAARELLAAFHPMAVVSVLCPKSIFLRLAGPMLREARFPNGLVEREQDATIRETEGWFGTHLSQCLEQFVERTGCHAAQLLEPPAPDSDDALAYCPRCLSQFTGVDARCANCGGRALSAF